MSDARPRTDQFARYLRVAPRAPSLGALGELTIAHLTRIPFENISKDSFSERATFMHALLVARFSPTRSVTLRNLTLIEAEGTSYRVRQVPGREHLPQVIEEYFRIPHHITREAFEGVELSRQA